MRFFDAFGEKFGLNLQKKLGPLMSRDFPLDQIEIKRILKELEYLSKSFTLLQGIGLNSILIQKIYSKKKVYHRLKKLKKSSRRVENLIRRFEMCRNKSSEVGAALSNLKDYNRNLHTIETQILLILEEVAEMKRTETIPEIIDEEVSPIRRMKVIVVFLNLLVDSFQRLLDNWPEEFLSSQMDLVSEKIDKK
jgi:hypothetical protein